MGIVVEITLDFLQGSSCIDYLLIRDKQFILFFYFAYKGTTQSQRLFKYKGTHLRNPIQSRAKDFYIAGRQLPLNYGFGCNLCHVLLTDCFGEQSGPESCCSCDYAQEHQSRMPSMGKER